MSGKTYARTFPAHLWGLDVHFNAMTRDKFDPIYAYCLARQVDGVSFAFSSHDRHAPRGAATGTIVVSGGSQTGASLDVSGCTHSVTGILKAGDLIMPAGNTKVYMATADVDSDGSGLATIPIAPDLIASPANGASVTVSGVSFTVTQSEEVHESETGVDGMYLYSLKLLESY